jgi:ABC-2 type transport system permease protein
LYGAYAAAAFRDRLAYRTDALLGVAGAAIKILLAAVLWTAVFAGKETVAGMGLGQMVSYYVLAMVLAQADRSDEYVWTFAAEIRSGDFAKNLVRPVDPLGVFLAVAAGRSAVHAAAAVAAAALIAFVGTAAAPGAFAAPDPAGIALALPVAALGLLSLALLNFMTAILAFAFQDITPFHLVKGNLVELLSGAVLPLAVLPAWAGAVLAWTPFPAMVSAPVRLSLGFGFSDYGRTLLVAALWAAGLAVAARLAYRALASRFEGVGL